MACHFNNLSYDARVGVSIALEFYCAGVGTCRRITVEILPLANYRACRRDVRGSISSPVANGCAPSARWPIGAYPYRTGERQGLLAPSGPCLGGGKKTGVQLQRFLEESRSSRLRVLVCTWLLLSRSGAGTPSVRLVSSLPTVGSERLHYPCVRARAVPN